MPLSASEAESFGWSVFQWFKGHLSTACDEYDEMRRNMLAGTDKDPRGREEMAAYTSIAALQHSSRHFGDALDSQSWRPAARFGMHVLGVYLLVYPRFQPIASVHALQVAKALWNAGRAELASELLEIVVTSVRISHGETAGSGMLRESKALLEMAGEELGG
nr:hypothetical protein HK105_001305 [Polyrhizophydium stewartii]